MASARRRGSRAAALWGRVAATNGAAHVAAAGGRLLGRFNDAQGDSPVLLLTTTGRKSGKLRTHPLLYAETDDGYVVVASNAGADAHPAWYWNIEANPAVSVQVGKAHHAATAHVASADERKALWPKLLEMFTGFDAYQAETDRELPVVVLEVQGD